MASQLVATCGNFGSLSVSGGCLCRVVDPIAKGALIDISAGAMIGSPGSGLDARPNQSTQIPPRQSGKLSQRQGMLMALGGGAFDA